MEKAAKSAGLGAKSVKKVPVNEDLTMNVKALELQITKDIANGYHPFMVVGTSGTTGAGAFDDLEKIAKVCKTYK